MATTFDGFGSRYDVIVVGARAAGAATALALARRGARVLAVDRDRYGTDTLSTHALMRPAVLQLQRWGVLDALLDLGTPVVRSTTFHYGAEEVAVALKPRDGIEGLVAPRRILLDALLADAAGAAGAEVRYGTRVLDVVKEPDGRVSGVVLEDDRGRPARVEAALVIGADGMRSRVARAVGAETYRLGRHRSALLYGYWPVAVEGYHWYWAPGAAAGAIPTNDGLTCVFVATTPARFRTLVQQGTEATYRSLLEEAAPGLAGPMASLAARGGLRGFGGERSFFRRAWGPGWALVGDAGYFKDPLTAHGLTDALRDAELLARAVGEGGAQAFARYQATRDALSSRFFELTDAIASFEWDLPAIRQLHLDLRDATMAELETVQGFAAADARRPAAVTPAPDLTPPAPT